MSKRNVGTTNIKVPDNPVWIEFPRSDGDSRTWPSHTTYVEDNQGQVNWMKEVPIDHPVAIKWRRAVGNTLAMDTGIEPASNAILKDWPANYKMYDHHKGPARGNIRHDIYLYGPISRRFRSPLEFAAHAMWLYRDPTMDTNNCFCKYCKKVPQKIISDAIAHSASAPPPSQSTPSATAGPSTAASAGRDMYTALQKQGWAKRDTTSLAQRRAHREQRVRQKGKSKGQDGEEFAPKVFAAVQKQLRPATTLKPSESILDMPMLAERNRDLRAVYSRSANDKMGAMGWDEDDETALMNLGVQSGMAEPPALVNQANPPLRRWFRQNEVVWVQLPGEGIPLTEPGMSDPLNITAWPAIINEPKVKNTPIPIASPHYSLASGGYSSQPQGKQLDSLSINQDTTLNGSSRISSPSNPSLPALQSQLFPSPAPQLQLQSSSNTASAPVPSLTSVSLPPSAPAITATATTTTNSPNGLSAAPVLGARPPTPRLPLPEQSTSAIPIPDLPATESSAWIIKESTVYDVRLIGSDIKVDVADWDVLPYLAHAPIQELIDHMRTVPPDCLNFDRDTIGRYDPFAASTTEGKAPIITHEEAVEKAHEAASAFSLAVQIAATLCGYWSLTDKWDFLHVSPETDDVQVNVVSNSQNEASEDDQPLVPPPAAMDVSISAPPMMTTTTTTVPGGLSLRAAIEEAGRSNAAGASTYSKKMNLNAIVGSGPVYKEISGTRNSMSEQEVRQIAAATLGLRASDSTGSGEASPSGNSGNGVRKAIASALTQVRFQGMWWGPERIWVDDFVRLKVGRASLAPNGAPNVYKASGWGKKSLEDWTKIAQLLEERKNAFGPSATPHSDLKGKGRDLELPYLPELPAYQGANLRGVFMKIDGIFVVDVPKGDGKLKKEGRVCGTLYELAEIDWEETEPDLREEYESEVQLRRAYLERRNLRGNAQSMFQASVNESLLPSTWKGRAPPPPASQSSPPSHYLIPQAPKGYRFRPILKAGYEAVLTLSLVSGRYYPRLLSHPALAATIARALTVGRRDGTLKHSNNLFALEGLCAGHFNAVDPTVYKKSRVQMIEHSDQSAMEEMEKFKELKESQWAQDGRDAMEEDEDGGADEQGDELQAMNVD